MYNGPMPRQPEGKLVAAMKKILVERGARPIKIHGSDEGLQEIGLPDLVVCHRGLFLGLEAKQPGGRLRPSQRVVLHEIFSAGGIVGVVETVGQLRSLLATIEDGSYRAGTAMCFNRGSMSRRFTL